LVDSFRFRLEDDLSVRVARAKTYEQAKLERFARFSLWPAIAGPNSPFRPSKEGYTSLTTGSFLDSLMAEIPGVVIPSSIKLVRGESPLSLFNLALHKYVMSKGNKS